jgi:hypothetical protein
MLEGAPLKPNAAYFCGADAHVRSRPLAGHSDRIANLEAALADLRSDLESLKEQFAGYRKQFE